MGFNYLKATDPVRGDTLLFTPKFPEISSTDLTSLGRMKGSVDLGATYLIVLNPGNLDWKSSAQTTWLLLLKMKPFSGTTHGNLKNFSK